MSILADRDINYSFTGDTKSLRDATNEAISLLNEYQDAFNETSRATNSGFGGDNFVSSGSDFSAAWVVGLKVVLKLLDKLLDAFKELLKLEAKFIAQLYKGVITGIPTLIATDLKALSQFGNILEQIGEVMGNVLFSVPDTLSSIAQVLAGWGVGEKLADATTSAMDMVEATNLFEVAMRNSIATGREFITVTSEMFGLDPTNLQSMVGLFYEMGAAVDVPTAALDKMSLGLTAMSLNISSLFNVDIETVSDNLTSGLRGMSRAVVKYGMDLRASTVQAYLDSIGVDQYFESMNEASREIARYLVMVKQAADANNDFAETIESPANQLRVFKEQITQLGREVGRVFAGLFQNVLPVVNGIVMAIRLVIEAILDLVGIFTGATNRDLTAGADDVADSVSGIGDAAGGAAKDMKNLLAPFDELNILAEQAAGASGGVGGTGDLELVDPKLLEQLDKVDNTLGNIRMKAMDVRDAILEFLGLEYDLQIDPDTGETISKIKVIPGEFADRLIEAWEDHNWKKVGDLLGRHLSTLLVGATDKVSWDNVGDDITKGIKAVADVVNSFVGSFNWNGLGKFLGASLNTAINSVNTWLTSANFTLFGMSLARALNGFISEMEPGLVGTTLANYLNSIIDFATGFAYNFEWDEFLDQLVSSIQSFFASVEWSKFTTTAIYIINHLTDALVNFVETTPWDDVKEAIITNLQNLFINANWVDFLIAASELMWRLVEAVLEAIVTADWTEIKDKIVGKIQAFFENGDYMIFIQTAVALFNLLVDALADIALTTDWSAVKTNIIAALEYVFNEAKITEFLEAATEIVSQVILALVEFMANNQDKFREIGETLGECLAKLPWGELLAGAISSIGSALWAGVKGWFSTRMSNLSGDDWIESSRAEFGSMYTESQFNRGSGFGGTDNFAVGGVVTSPTRAIIGELGNSEAVIPLGDSPQVEELLQKFADISGTGSSSPVFHVYIGGREVDAEIYLASERGKTLVGSQPVTVR